MGIFFGTQILEIREIFKIFTHNLEPNNEKKTRTEINYRIHIPASGFQHAFDAVV